MRNSTPLKVTGAAVALALSALAGPVQAQAKAPGYVTDSQGQALASSTGLCWRTSEWSPDKALAPCDVVASAGTTAAPAPVAAAPATAPQQVAQATQPRAAQTTAPAGTPRPSIGYLTDSTGRAVTSSTGLCWRTTAWSPAQAAAPCDAVAVVQAAPPPPPPVAVAPAPPPEPPAVKPEPVTPPPAVVAQPAPQPPLIEKIDVAADVLFEFDRAELRPAGRERLDEIAERVKGADVEQVVAIGHTDRIGDEQYNVGLSERRAQAVRDYLVQRGIDPQNIRTEGRGPNEPVTDGQCRNLRGQQLIACLQPDRRVEVEVRGTREAAAGEAPAAAGAGATR
jgi:OmpA-OmpF porin, OOP family